MSDPNDRDQEVAREMLSMQPGSQGACILAAYREEIEARVRLEPKLSAERSVAKARREWAQEEAERYESLIAKARAGIETIHNDSAPGEHYYEQSGGAMCVRDDHYRHITKDDLRKARAEGRQDALESETRDAIERLTNWPVEDVVAFYRRRAIADPPASKPEEKLPEHRFVPITCRSRDCEAFGEPMPHSNPECAFCGRLESAHRP
jgi:hypothetical protein